MVSRVTGVVERLDLVLGICDLLPPACAATPLGDCIVPALCLAATPVCALRTQHTAFPRLLLQRTIAMDQALLSRYITTIAKVGGQAECWKTLRPQYQFCSTHELAQILKVSR